MEQEQTRKARKGEGTKGFWVWGKFRRRANTRFRALVRLHLRHRVQYRDLPAISFTKAESRLSWPFSILLRLEHKELKTGLCFDLDILEIAYAKGYLKNILFYINSEAMGLTGVSVSLP